MRAGAIERDAPARRVMITGLGVVSSIGLGADAFGAGLRRGRGGLARCEGETAKGFPFEYGGEVHGFDPARWIRRQDPAALGRTSQFAVAAARMALDDARLDVDALPRDRCAVSAGTTD